MEVQLIEVKTKRKKAGIISSALLKDMPKKRDGWNFTWRVLYKTEGSAVYKLTLNNTPLDIEGVLMLTLMNEEMLYMNTIEVAPQNFGTKGKHDKVAGCLIAFACLKSFELGQNNYHGYLTFDSKTELVGLYSEKYYATLVTGQKMFIKPESAIDLIEKYLDRKL